MEIEDLLPQALDQTKELITAFCHEAEYLKLRREEEEAITQTELEMRDKEAEKLSGEISTTKTLVLEILAKYKRGLSNTSAERDNLKKELEKNAIASEAKEKNMVQSIARIELQLRNALADLEKEREANQILQVEMEALRTTHVKEINELRAETDREKNTDSKEQNLLRVIWQVTSHEEMTKEILMVFRDFPTFLKDIITGNMATQRGNTCNPEVLQKIMTATGILVNMLASAEGRFHLISNSNLVDFAIQMLHPFIKRIRDPSLTELFLNLLGNLSVDREGAISLLNSGVAELLRDLIVGAKNAPYQDNCLELCTDLLHYVSSSAQSSKKPFWELLKHLEKDRQKPRVWKLYEAWMSHFSEE